MIIAGADPLDAAHDIHQEAMTPAEEAFLAERRGDHLEAKRLHRLSFLKEEGAAYLLKSSREVEPTRSVLFRSAASLALRCGETCAAERLAAEGLAGNPPEEIADELQAVRAAARERGA